MFGIIISFFSLQSGTVPGHWTVLEEKTDYRKRAFGLGKLVGCEQTDTQQLVECLNDVPADDIVQASLRVSFQLYRCRNKGNNKP